MRVQDRSCLVLKSDDAQHTVGVRLPTVRSSDLAPDDSVLLSSDRLAQA